MGKRIAGKLFYGVVCLLAAVLLVVSGYAHKVVGFTTHQGQPLPNSLLTAMHAGNASAVNAGQVGSQDTNTLILIHIFAGGQKAVGFSIPRDDLVTYPQAYDGQSEGKIDGAYAYADTQYLNENGGKESKADLYLHANQAGQAATVATVESVTGQHVDHFVE